MLSICVLRFPPASRRLTRQLYDDAGGYGYEDFFPPEDRYDLNRQLLDAVPNLDHYASDPAIPWDQMQLKTSLANVFRVTNPIVVLDEWGGTFSESAFRRVCDLNPSIVVRVTPMGRNDKRARTESNVLVRITREGED